MSWYEEGMGWREALKEVGDAIDPVAENEHDEKLNFFNYHNKKGLSPEEIDEKWDSMQADKLAEDAMAISLVEKLQIREECRGWDDKVLSDVADHTRKELDGDVNRGVEFGFNLVRARVVADDVNKYPFVEKTPTEQAADVPASRIICREAEWHRLGKFVADALKGKLDTRCMVIKGLTGVGKTSLVECLLRTLTENGAMGRGKGSVPYYMVNCNSLGKKLFEVLSSRMGLPQSGANTFSKVFVEKGQLREREAQAAGGTRSDARRTDLYISRAFISLR